MDSPARPPVTVSVDYLPKPVIEAEAAGLLQGYFDEAGMAPAPPIPVDEILEVHLGLSLDFDNLRSLLGVPDVLGALWVNTREVVIDTKLDPELDPGAEGRFHFSVAHEIGHWTLHRGYLPAAEAHPLARAAVPPNVICRTSQARARIEWQADYFASCLLMPEALVRGAWFDHYGSPDPIVCTEVEDPPRPLRPTRRGMKPISETVWNIIEHMAEPRPSTFESVARPLTRTFRVSNQAMRIQLASFGLLQVDPTTDGCRIEAI